MEEAKMSDQLIRKIEKMYMRDDLPDFKPGDTVKVYYKIVEGDKVRVQFFQGIVIAKDGSGTNQTFTVRKIASGGIGVEQIFPLHSPAITNIEVVRRGKVRRAKLYYLREKVGKAAKVKELRVTKKDKEKNKQAQPEQS